MAERNPNDRMLDELLLSAILSLVSFEELGKQAVILLNDTEPRLAAMIRATKTGLLTRDDFRKMSKLLGRIHDTRIRAWERIEAVVARELERAAKEEPGKIHSIAREALDMKRLGAEFPTSGVIAALMRRAFEGRTLTEWFKTQRDNDLARIDTQVRLGLMLRESPDKIARRVMGDARLRGANGATQTARQRLYELVVLGGLFFVGQAQREFTLLNPDIFDRELYVAVLDNRTTVICRSLHGQIFRVGDGPYPPLHFWCRSRRVPLLVGFGPPVIESFAAWLAAQDEGVQQRIRDALGDDRQFPSGR